MWKRVAVAGLSQNSPGYSSKPAGVFSERPLAANATLRLEASQRQTETQDDSAPLFLRGTLPLFPLWLFSNVTVRE